MVQRISRRHKSRKESPGGVVIVGLTLVVAAAAFLGWQSTQVEPEVEQPVVEARAPVVGVNPFEARETFAAAGSTGPVETELKSLVALQVWRKMSRDAAWALAVDLMSKAYPLIVQFRVLKKADPDYENFLWMAPGQEALRLIARADEYGLRVEQKMRDDREIGPNFEGVREARSEWTRFRRELERAVGTLEHPMELPETEE